MFVLSKLSFAEFEKPYMKELTNFLRGRSKTEEIFPPYQNIFRALNISPFDQVKAVIVGQDPYHGQGQADGLSFSVQTKAIPPSLTNIFQELANDIPDFVIPQHGNLESWGKQGVLLLNTCLTVDKGVANSHKNQGWEKFSDHVIETISSSSEHIVFILWGKFAQQKIKLIDSSKHCILTAAHPSPLSARRGFFGCKHFSKANEYLKKNGKDLIDWKLPLETF